MIEGQNRPTGPSGLAKLGVGVGVLAVALAFVPFVNVVAPVFGLIAVALSVLGLSQARQLGGSTRLAMTGIVLGIVAFALGIATIAACGALVSTSATR